MLKSMGSGREIHGGGEGVAGDEGGEGVWKLMTGGEGVGYKVDDYMWVTGCRIG